MTRRINREKIYGTRNFVSPGQTVMTCGSSTVSIPSGLFCSRAIMGLVPVFLINTVIVWARETMRNRVAALPLQIVRFSVDSAYTWGGAGREPEHLYRRIGIL